MKTSDRLRRGELYGRATLASMFDIHDATLKTGVFQPRGSSSIWLFVTETKTPDRTDYDDRLVGDRLHWDGQTSGRTDSLIISHKRRGLEILLFYRETKNRYPGYAFRYEGPFEYVSHRPGRPSHFVLDRVSNLDTIVRADLEALQLEESPLVEGGRRYRYSSYFEREPRLRSQAIRIHGTTCMVCGFNFEQAYGERGSGYIEVHHIVPVCEQQTATEINPRTDMVVVCANCHRMIHRKQDRVLSVRELQEALNRNTSDPQ